MASSIGSDFNLSSGFNSKEEIALDLSIEQDVCRYLNDNTVFKTTDVIPLSGGTANYVFRLKLATPYLGRETLVLKHAKPYVKQDHLIPFGLDRQIYEVEALRVVGNWIQGGVVTVPQVHMFDEGRHVIIMDDAGEGSIPLKALMTEGKVTLALAREIGSVLGIFLGGLHKWGKGNEEACKAVRGNELGKKMSAWAYYGRLKETLMGAEDVPMLSDPPLALEEKDLEVVDSVAQETIQKIVGENHQFTMGDFWPGNLMVALDETGALKHIYVLDWELSKTGLPGIDVGQFSAEMHLLRSFYPEICGEAAQVVLERFLREYKRVAEPSEEDIKRATVHLGTHLVVLAGRVEWGGKEQTREVVLEGVRTIVDGSNMIFSI